MTTQLTLMPLPPLPYFANGETFDAALDAERLKGQHHRVYAVMRDGDWRSLADLADQTGYPEASISARLRDFRKPRFGSHTVERRRVGGGLFQYRLAP